jgi:hypothetical protein
MAAVLMPVSLQKEMAFIFGMDLRSLAGVRRLNKELKKLKPWGENNRRDYVQKQGWATMPGEKKPDGQVADEVADLLAKLKL